LTKILIVIAAVADLAIAALLIGVSGFIFAGGPNAGTADTLTAVLYVGAVVGCIALPIVALLLSRKGKTGPALIAAFAPAAVGFLVLLAPVL
jgi:hypothetical protein